MRNTCSIITVLIAAALPVLLLGAELKLPAQKDRVIPGHTRIKFLDGAETYLLHAGGEPLEPCEEDVNPFSFDEPVKKIDERAPEEVKPVEPEVRYNYDNSTVLNIVAENLSTQVTGTLAMGGRRFLQLKGGRMLQPGAVFPAHIPELKDKTFNVSIHAIDDQGYTLKLGDTTKHVTFDPMGNGAKRESPSASK